MWSISTQYNVVIKKCPWLLHCSNFVLLEFNPYGDATLTFECFFFVFAVQWYYWQSSKLFSELAFEDFLCLYFRVTRRFMLRMQRKLNTGHSGIDVFFLHISNPMSKNVKRHLKTWLKICLYKWLWIFIFGTLGYVEALLKSFCFM